MLSSARLTAAGPGITFEWMGMKTLSLKLIRKVLSGYLGRKVSAGRTSFAALAEDLAGCVEGPDGLSVNPDHLAGYGR